MLLGELLLRAGTLHADQVEEALAAQVINGGRLGTNLVELGHLSEEQLARALGRQHGIASAWGEIVPAPQALALVDLNFADEKDVLPVRLEGNRLWLLVINPDDLQTQDVISARASKRIIPVVVPEFRMAQLQRRHCKAFRPVRQVDIEALRRRWKTTSGPEEREDSSELMNEEEFQALYAAALRGGVANQSQIEDAIILEEDSETALACPGAAILPTVELELEEIESRSLPRLSPEEVEHRRSVERRSRQERPEDSRPITFAEAQKALAGITNRDDIARVVLRFAAGKFPRAMILSIKGDFAIGWHAAGNGIQPAIAPTIAIPLKNPSAFKLVRESRSHFLGPLRRDFASKIFLRALGGDEPRSAVLMPILAAGRVVNILYGDGGPGQFASPDVGELLILAQRVGRSYEQMIAARKAHLRR